MKESQPFDPDLARRLAQIVHDRCPDAPHDIGIELAQAVRLYVAMQIGWFWRQIHEATRRALDVSDDPDESH